MNKKITPALLFLTLGIGAVGVMHSNSVAVKAANGDAHKLAFGEVNHAIAINPDGVRSPSLHASSDGETLTITATDTGYYLSNTIALEAGNTYLFSFDVMLPDSGALNVALNGTWGATTTFALYSGSLTAGEYNHFSGVYEATEDKTEQIILQIKGTPENGAFRFQNIFLEKQHDVIEGSPIGAILPSLPANTADKLYDYWTIDGQKIDAETIYSFSGDKLALPHYSERHSLTFQYQEGKTSPNVFVNGDFESLDGWNTSGANVSLQSEVAKEGKALKFERASDTAPDYFQSQEYHVFSNSTYRLTFDVKVENASGIEFSTFVSGTYVSWKDYFTTSVTANCDWTTISADFNVSPELVTTAFVGFKFYSGTGTVYLDNAKLELVKNTRYYVQNDVIGDLPDLPTKEGYHAAWTIDGEALSADTAWKWDEDKVAGVTFAANQYTATFEADGKVVKTVPFIVEDTEINEPEIPAKEGYSAHWEDYTLRAGDITIKAIYEANQYSITIKDGEPGNVLSIVQIKYGQKLSDVIPEWPSLGEKEGYRFDHWAMNGAPVTLDTVFEHEGDAEIYAVYEAIQYTATFKADGTVVATIPFTVEDTTIEEPEIPAKEGYTAHWENYTLAAGDITIKAIYEPIQYTATFMADGTVIATVPFTVEDTAIEEPEIPAKKGYSAHWEEYTLTAGDITIKAVYEANQYSITFKDGESGNVLSTVQIKYGQKLGDVIQEWPSLEEKEGYEFDHWAMNGAPVTLDTVFEYEGNVEIYAVYKKIEVEVPTSSEEPQTPTDSHSQTSSGATEQSQASEGLNAGAIAGIVIAACAVAAGLGVGLYFWLRPKKGKTK